MPLWSADAESMSVTQRVARAAVRRKWESTQVSVVRVVLSCLSGRGSMPIATINPFTNQTIKTFVEMSPESIETGFGFLGWLSLCRRL